MPRDDIPIGCAVTLETPTIVLFDIDGTLIDSGGAGRRALSRAFDDVCGRADACRGIQLGGMTDWAIIRAALTGIGEEPLEDRIQTVLGTYLSHLREELARSEGFRVLPGARDLVRKLRNYRLLAIGLGTGNLRQGAALKLAHEGFYEEFAFGGFGCDHESRPEILRAGFRRGAEELRQAWDDCRRIVIGDTPKDVSAAQAVGAECIAVATGTFNSSDLRGVAPDLVVEDLRDEGAFQYIVSPPS